MKLWSNTLASCERRGVEVASGQRQHDGQRVDERVDEAGEHAVGQEQRAHAAAAGVEGLVQRRAAGGAYVHDASSRAAAARHRQARHQVHALEQVAARRVDGVRARHCQLCTEKKYQQVDGGGSV